MNSILELLSQCRLFRGIDLSLLQKELLPHGNIKKYAKGSYILYPQEEQQFFSLILQGRIQILHLFSDGQYSIMDVLEAKEIFGADLICTKSRIAPYHAVATEDTQLLCFPWSLPFQPNLLSESLRQELQLRLLQMVANFNMQKDYRLAILSRKGLRERIMTYLQMQAVKRQVNTFEIPFSRDDLASFLCVNRSALSHELSKMQQEGLIRFRKNRFTLLAP